MFKQFKNDVQFYVVYIKEAHALDGSSPMSRPGGPLVQEPVTLKERQALAQQCATAMKIKEIPTLVDDILDNTSKSYAALPDRLFLVGKDGKLAYVGGRGPRGFKPDELKEAIKKELAPKEVSTPEKKKGQQ